VVDRLVAGACPRTPQLQVRQTPTSLHERLLRQAPGQRDRWEGAPLVAGTEPGGPVTPHAEPCEILVVDVVVQPAKEGDQLVIGDEPGAPDVDGCRNAVGGG